MRGLGLDGECGVDLVPTTEEAAAFLKHGTVYERDATSGKSSTSKTVLVSKTNNPLGDQDEDLVQAHQGAKDANPCCQVQ
jgi:hypothetical protein